MICIEILLNKFFFIQLGTVRKRRSTKLRKTVPFLPGPQNVRTGLCGHTIDFDFARKSVDDWTSASEESSSFPLSVLDHPPGCGRLLWTTP